MQHVCVGVNCVTCSTNIVKLMNNKDKIKAIIDKQIDKLFQMSENSKLPLLDEDINTLTKLAKLVGDGEKLDTTETKNILDEFTPEELILIQKHRQLKDAK